MHARSVTRTRRFVTSLFPPAEHDIVKSLQCEELEVTSQSSRGGRTMRVAGVGGSSKMKFGGKAGGQQGVEARATGYSRHVNLSVKINK